jgi:NAD(P)-dependent dehydrogenase (short-subunit alcohol dehydrogenase family)
MSVADLVVLVTGAARGMGREYVRAFLREGAEVIATDISWAPSGVSNDDVDFEAELRGNEAAMTEVMDVTVDSHVKRVYAAAMQRFGRVDVVINNAGLRQRDLYPPHGSVTLLDTEVGDWQRMFDTQVFGAVRVIKAFVPQMLERRRGSVINIGSGGWRGEGRASREMPYKSAKAALCDLTFYLSHEVKPYNVAANVLLPGHTFSSGSIEQENARAQIRRLLDPEAAPHLPLRLRPDHVTPLALHLAQQDASGITGEELSALAWNEANGFGGREEWAYGPDLEARRAAGLT